MAKKYFTSDLETAGTLDVAGTTTLASVGVTGAATVGTDLAVTGAATVGTDLGVTGAATVGTTLGVTGNYSSAGGSITLTNGNIALTNGGITTGGASTVQSLGVIGAATVGATLNVTGMSTLTGGLTIDELTINSTGVLDTGDNGISVGDGSVTADAGNFQTSSGNITTTSGYVKAPKVQNVSDLTLICDSGGAESTSKIKFCKDDLGTPIELASIDQAGTLSLGVNADSNYAKIQSTKVPGNNIEFLASGSDNLFINSAGDIKLSPTNQVEIAANKNVNLGTDCDLVFPSSNPGQITLASGNTGFFIYHTGISALGSQSISLASGNLTVGGDITFSNLQVDTNNNIAEHRVNIRNDNAKLTKTSASSYFSQGHIYHSTVELALGSAVSLANGVINLTQAANEANCVGIVAASQALDDTNTIEDSLGTVHTSGYLYKLASLGDSRYKQCNGFKVCNEGGDIQPGDLLVTSSTPGYLMKQDDDIIRSKTVGKCMQEVTFDSNGQAIDVYGYLYCG